MLQIVVDVAEDLQAVLGPLGRSGYRDLPAEIRAVCALAQPDDAEVQGATALAKRLGGTIQALQQWSRTAPSELDSPVNIPWMGMAGAGKSTSIGALIDDPERLSVWGGAERGTEVSTCILDEESGTSGHPHAYTVVRYPEAWWRHMLPDHLFRMEFDKIAGDSLLVKAVPLLDDWSVRTVADSLRDPLKRSSKTLKNITDHTRTRSWTGDTPEDLLKKDIQQCGGYPCVYVQQIRKRAKEDKSCLGFGLVQLEDWPGFEANTKRQWTLHAMQLSLCQPTSTVAVLVAKPERLLASGLEGLLDTVLDALQANPELHLVVLVRNYDFMGTEPSGDAQWDAQISQLHRTLTGDRYRFSPQETEVWSQYKQAQEGQDSCTLQPQLRLACWDMLLTAATRYFEHKIMVTAAACLNCSSAAEFKQRHPSLAERIAVTYFVKWHPEHLDLLRHHLLDCTMCGFLRRMDLMTDPQVILDAVDALQTKRELVARMTTARTPSVKSYQAVNAALQPLADVASRNISFPHKREKQCVANAFEDVEAWARDYKALYTRLTDVGQLRKLLMQKTCRNQYIGMGKAIRDLVTQPLGGRVPELLQLAASVMTNQVFTYGGWDRRPKEFSTATKMLLRSVHGLISACGNQQQLDESEQRRLKDAVKHHLRRALLDDTLAPLRRYHRTPHQAPVYKALLAATARYQQQFTGALHIRDNLRSAKELVNALAPHLAAVFKIMGEHHGPEEPGFLPSVDQVVANMYETLHSLPKLLAEDVQYQMDKTDIDNEEYQTRADQGNALGTRLQHLKTVVRGLHGTLSAAVSALEHRAQAYTRDAKKQTEEAAQEECERYAAVLGRAAKVLGERRERLRPLAERKRTRSASRTPARTSPGTAARSATSLASATTDNEVEEEPEVVSFVRRVMPPAIMHLRGSTHAPATDGNAVDLGEEEDGSDQEDSDEDNQAG